MAGIIDSSSNLSMPKIKVKMLTIIIKIVTSLIKNLIRALAVSYTHLTLPTKRIV